MVLESFVVWEFTSAHISEYSYKHTENVIQHTFTNNASYQRNNISLTK
uniref:Uncharacterized protein n=1 Tax=Anguilla anguilla TaxID=7936 RepID=A0A0E9XP72_ANGAN